MLGSIISEIVGEAVIELLFPGRSKRSAPPPEGTWNASLGSLSAFLGLLAAMFATMSSITIVSGHGDFPAWPFLGASVVVAILAGTLGARAFLVTDRRHALAHVGLWLCRTTLALATVTAVLAALGIRVSGL
jgi:hypothetical protein